MARDMEQKQKDEKEVEQTLSLADRLAQDHNAPSVDVKQAAAAGGSGAAAAGIAAGVGDLGPSSVPPLCQLHTTLDVRAAAFARCRGWRGRRGRRWLTSPRRPTTPCGQHPNRQASVRSSSRAKSFFVRRAKTHDFYNRSNLPPLVPTDSVDGAVNKGGSGAPMPPRTQTGGPAGASDPHASRSACWGARRLAL